MNIKKKCFYDEQVCWQKVFNTINAGQHLDSNITSRGALNGWIDKNKTRPCANNAPFRSFCRERLSSEMEAQLRTTVTLFLLQSLNFVPMVSFHYHFT